MSFIEKILTKVATKIYLIGKSNFEKSFIENNYKKGKIDSSVRFSMKTDIQNLSSNVDAIIIGKSSNIEGLILVYPYGGKVIIGEYCSLSPNSRLVSTSTIRIGNRVLIAHNVNIIDNNSHPIDAEQRHQDFIESFSIGMQPHNLSAAPIVIEDDVWIGHNTTILKGVTIGQGAIIGSNSVVTKNIEPFTVNVGNPLRVIKNTKNSNS